MKTPKQSLNRRRFLQTGSAVALIGALPKSAWSSPPFQEDPPKQFAQNWQNEVPVFTHEDFEGRRQQAQALMGQLGLDALILTGGADFTYFYNLSWWPSERLFCSILPRRGETRWVCPAFEESRARECIGVHAKIVAWEEHQSPYGTVKSVAQELGLTTGHIAFGPAVRQFESAGIITALPSATFLNGARVTEGCRSVKDEKELTCLEIANKLTKIAYRKAFNALHEGMLPSDLAHSISSAHSELGVKGGGYPQFGPSSSFPHGSRETKRLSDGDVILVDGGCSVQGYRSDVSRTLVFGRAHDRHKRVFDLILKAQQIAHRAVRPGLPCGELDRLARKVIDDGGFGTAYRFFAHRLGHGIGLEGHEAPYLVQDNPLPLTSGMAFSNEPGIYIPGEFGMRIEDCFAVTAEGARFFGGMLCSGLELPFG